MTDTTQQANTQAHHVQLGRGYLTWGRVERITDRYGSVWTYGDSPGHDNTLQEAAMRCCEGMVGNLLVKVVATRTSHHIGDIARGLYPETPQVGETIMLGSGTLFTENGAVGVRPLDGRDVDWLNPRNLYRAHDQLVNLLFEPSLTSRAN